MGKPSVILTSQFTLPTAKSFTKYVRYMTRKEAILEKEKELSIKEQEELQRIDAALKTFKIDKGMTYGLSNNKKKLSPKEKEAANILKSKDYFLDKIDYEKYIRYMTREYALERKKELSKAEIKELQVIKESISKIPKEEVKEKKDYDIKHSIFSINKESMTEKDIEEVAEIIGNAENNGSVFYQDVISFDISFLEKEGIYNSKTNELDEKKIQYASSKMMDQMFKDEKIENGYWFAAIHGNTDHIHIHYGTVETSNTRPLKIIENENGEKYFEPKGKRKQKTIDNMKSTFTNTLIDRTAELSRISELRNILVQDVKENYDKDKIELEQKKLIDEIYNELPSNRKYWQYGSKEITNLTRQKIDRLTYSLMNDNEDYREYIQKVKEEGEYRKELFGDSKRSEKDYAGNKVEEIHKRLGNSLLKEMKNDAYKIERNRKFYKQERMNKQYQYKNYNNNKPIIRKKNLYQIKRALNDDYDKYRAEKDYEYMQQKIAQEQERNTL